jgi:hypothetical protein
VAEQNQGEEERRLLVAQHEANVKKLEGYMVSEKFRQEELLRAQIEERNKKKLGRLRVVQERQLKQEEFEKQKAAELSEFETRQEEQRRREAERIKMELEEEKKREFARLAQALEFACCTSTNVQILTRASRRKSTPNASASRTKSWRRRTRGPSSCRATPRSRSVLCRYMRTYADVC